jgi:hypothetical protein
VTHAVNSEPGGFTVQDNVQWQGEFEVQVYEQDTREVMPELNFESEFDESDEA